MCAQASACAYMSEGPGAVLLLLSCTKVCQGEKTGKKQAGSFIRGSMTFQQIICSVYSIGVLHRTAPIFKKGVATAKAVENVGNETMSCSNKHSLTATEITTVCFFCLLK